MNGIKVIVAFVCGFLVAQLVKFLVGWARGESKKSIKDFRSGIRYLMKSGGMPSGHAASFSAASVCLGFLNGFDSCIFALAVCMTAIVLYDAVNVRFVVGEQGKALNKLIEKPIKIAEGHTIFEVFVGILLGVLIGLIVFFVI